MVKEKKQDGLLYARLGDVTALDEAKADFPKEPQYMPAWLAKWFGA